jgi:hypothetical protein
MKAIDVIRIGRRRRRLASMAAAIGVRPAIQFPCELHDQNRVLRRQSHQHEQADLSEDVVVVAGDPTPNIAASSDIGTIRMIASGSVRLSYCAASTRNTSSITIGRCRAMCCRRGSPDRSGRSIEADALGQRLIGDARDGGLRLAGGKARRGCR